MSHYRFHLDIKDGAKAEQMVLEFFKRNFPQAHQVKGKESRWDILIPELNGLSIEVKNDLYFAKSGNLAFETHRLSGELSGLGATKANFWVHILGGDMYIMPTSELKSYIANGNFRSVWGGDNKATSMFLVPFTKISTQSWFIKIG